MGKLDYGNRLSVRTPPEILEEVNTLLARLQTGGLKFRGRKLGLEGLVGCVLLDFLSLESAQQVALVAARLPEMEVMTGYAADGEADGQPTPSPAETDPVATQSIQVDVKTGRPITPKRKRKGAG